MAGSVFRRNAGNAGDRYMSANDTQVGGAHYRDKKIQTWDYITENNIPYLEGCVIKYVSRWRGKNGVEDLRKAQHYLEKLIENAA
jgi:hypothetical protein